jgi:UDP-3-O-[3-hydroxymyristoyl] glucosamine N-acyltransferase
MSVPTLGDLIQFLACREITQLPGFREDMLIERAMPAGEAGPNTVAFCGLTARDPVSLLAASHATLLIVDQTLLVNLDRLAAAGVQAVIRSPNPRLDFVRTIERFFTRPRPRDIHPTAVVDLEAVIDADVFIGAYCVIGQVTIGQGTVIHSGVHIYDGVRIGRNVTIHSGSVIGADGFGFERNEAGELEKFPHVGGVVIEDDVEICALTHVARGALADTFIGQGTKIDTFVHVAHNVRIGRHCVIISHAMLGGGLTIGDFSWVAPSACVRDRLSIGTGVTVGLGAVVTKDVPDNSTVMGVPARPADEQRRLLKRLSALAAEE